MSRRHLLSSAAHVRKTLRVDDPADPFSGGAFLFEQDCEPVVERARALRDAHGGHVGPAFKLAATVPLVVYQKAVTEGWADDADAWRRFLNDPENRDFRVYAGKV